MSYDVELEEIILFLIFQKVVNITGVVYRFFVNVCYDVSNFKTRSREEKDSKNVINTLNLIYKKKSIPATMVLRVIEWEEVKSVKESENL